MREKSVMAACPRDGVRAWNGKPRVALGRLKNELWCLLVLPRDSFAQNLTNISNVPTTCPSTKTPSRALNPRPQQGSRDTLTTCSHGLRRTEPGFTLVVSNQGPSLHQRQGGVQLTIQSMLWQWGLGLGGDGDIMGCHSKHTSTLGSKPELAGCPQEANIGSCCFLVSLNWS